MALLSPGALAPDLEARTVEGRIVPLHQRVSFLVAPDGTIAQAWPSVSPARHAEEVLEAVRRRTAGAAG
jgi:peroxiredoxin